MNWITRERPQIDRIACPWLISKFIDKEAKFFFVPEREIGKRAKLLDAITYDVPGAEYTHFEDQCTFDSFVSKFQIEDPAVHTIAPIVRAADTDRHDLAKEAAGLWAISSGLAHQTRDDHELLEIGMKIYDGLYVWALYLQGQKHTEDPSEQLLMNIYKNFIKHKSTHKKTPAWVKELRELIQDQIDTNFSLSLGEVSKNLDVHPAYLSREFSKYFDDLSFGDYFRRMRIEKGMKLIESEKYSMGEIAYLTGFSDQSHFSRIFKKKCGHDPFFI